jgi:uncharacterized membrane protein YqjE
MAEESGGGGGLFASLKALSANLLGILQTRLELIATDVAEERERLTALLIFVLVSLFSLGVGVVLLAILIVVALWETQRLVTLAALAAFFLTAGAGIGWLAMQKLRNSPRLFDASVAELAKDRQDLTSGS